MPETPEQLYERARDALRTPPVETWESWPFEGPVQPRPLLEPEPEERPRFGEEAAVPGVAGVGEEE